MWLIRKRKCTLCMESEHKKGILIRSLTTIVTFSRLTAKFSKANFSEEPSAAFDFFYKQWNWTVNVVASILACTCAKPWNPKQYRKLLEEIERKGKKEDNLRGDPKTTESTSGRKFKLWIFSEVSTRPVNSSRKRYTDMKRWKCFLWGP